MGVEEGIVTQLFSLGRLDADQEKKVLNEVNGSTILRLSDVWVQVGIGVVEKAISINRLTPLLLKYTAFAVLDARYKNADADSKKALSEALQVVSTALKNSPSLATFFAGLRCVVENPWGYSAIRVILGGNGQESKHVKRVKTVDIDRIWATEGHVFLDARLEFLGQRPLQLMRKEFFTKILYVLLMKGNEADLGEHSLEFEPHHLKEDQILEYWETYVLLWQTGDKCFDLEIFDQLSPSVALKILHRMKVQQHFPGRRLLPKICESVSQIDLFSITSKLLVETLYHDWHRKEIVELINFWLGMFKATVTVTDWTEKLRKVLMPLFENRKRIKKSEYIYDLAQSILQNFVKTEGILEFYLDVLIRAMNMDVDRISTLKAKGQNQDLKEARLELSERFMQLSNHRSFKKFSTITREFILTAFSLNPCRPKFRLLFPKNGSKKVSTRSVESSNLENNLKKLRLPEDLTDLLHEIIQKPRWGALRDFTKREDQRAHCWDLLQKGSDFLEKPQELQFVNPGNITKSSREQLKRKVLAMKNRNRKAAKISNPKVSVLSASKRLNNANEMVPIKMGGVHEKVQGTLRSVNITSSAANVRKMKCKEARNLKSVPLPKPSSNHPFPEPISSLSNVKQWQNYAKTLVSKGQEEQAKTAYTTKFLSPPKPLPRGYPWIPYPTVTIEQNKSSKNLRIRTNTKYAERKAPTRYVAHKSAGLVKASYELHDSDSGLDLETLRAAFRGEMSTSSDSQIPNIEDSNWDILGIDDIDNRRRNKMMNDIKRRQPFVNGCFVLNNLDSFKELAECTSRFYKKKENAQTIENIVNPCDEPRMKRKMLKLVVKTDAYITVKQNKGLRRSTSSTKRRENVEPQSAPDSFLLGILWDRRRRVEKIIMPPGPTSGRELFRNKMMVAGALKRARLCLQNIEQKEQKKDSKLAAAAINTSSSDILPPSQHSEAVANPSPAMAIATIDSPGSSSLSSSFLASKSHPHPQIPTFQDNNTLKRQEGIQPIALLSDSARINVSAQKAMKNGKRIPPNMPETEISTIITKMQLEVTSTPSKRQKLSNSYSEGGEDEKSFEEDDDKSEQSTPPVVMVTKYSDRPSRKKRENTNPPKPVQSATKNGKRKPPNMPETEITIIPPTIIKEVQLEVTPAPSKRQKLSNSHSDGGEDEKSFEEGDDKSEQSTPPVLTIYSDLPLRVNANPPKLVPVPSQ